MRNKSKAAKMPEVKKSSIIALDKKTQSTINKIVKVAESQAQQLQRQLQERLGLIIESYVNAKGFDGDYSLSKDFTKLEQINTNDEKHHLG